MANNPYVNKVEYGGQTIIDISGTTAVASDVAQGKIFFTASGAQATGTATSGGGALSIAVTAPTGATVTAIKDGSTYTGVEDQQNPGSYTISIPGYGTYTVTAAYQGQTDSKTVTVTAESVTLDAFVPAGYTLLEYIESTGTQYIDSGLSMNNGFVADFTVEHTAATSNGFILGAGSTARNYIGIYANKWELGSSTAYNGYSTSQNTKYTATAATITPPYLIVNGEQQTLTTIINGQPKTSVNLFIFAIHYENGPAGLYFVGRLYDQMAVYTDSGKTDCVARFFPVKRDSDDVVGLYDVVRGQFFTNAGSGVFTAGPEVT